MYVFKSSMVVLNLLFLNVGPNTFLRVFFFFSTFLTVRSQMCKARPACIMVYWFGHTILPHLVVISD